MATKLPHAEVRRVAELARLTLTEAETESFAADLSAILEWVRTVQQADTTGVEPTSRVSTGSALRDDRIEPSLDRDAALAAAPDANREHGLFRVPSVI